MREESLFTSSIAHKISRTFCVRKPHYRAKRIIAFCRV
jgi:hypothetical protein